MIKTLLFIILTGLSTCQKKINMKIKKKIYFTKPIVMENYLVELDNQSPKPLSKFQITINKDNFEYLKSIKVSELGTLLHETQVTK
jgi:hypothetical protein